jgi:hypothetical protein
MVPIKVDTLAALGFVLFSAILILAFRSQETTTSKALYGYSLSSQIARSSQTSTEKTRIEGDSQPQVTHAAGLRGVSRGQN